jgi:hypothetical protein
MPDIAVKPTLQGSLNSIAIPLLNSPLDPKALKYKIRLRWHTGNLNDSCPTNQKKDKQKINKTCENKQDLCCMERKKEKKCKNHPK